MAIYRAPEQDLAWHEKLSRWYNRPDAEIRNIVKLSSASSSKVDQIQNAYNRLAYEHLDVVNAIIKLWDHRTTVAFNRNSGFISSNKDQNHWVSQTDEKLLQDVQQKIAATVRSLSGGAESDLKAFRCFQRTLTETTRMLDLGYKTDLGGASRLERSVKDMVESGLIFHVDQENAAPQNLVGIFTKNAIRLVGDRGRGPISLETDHQVHLLDDKVQEHAHLELDAKLDFEGAKLETNQPTSQRYLSSLRSRVTAVLNQASDTILERALATPENAEEIEQAVEVGKQTIIDELLQDEGTQGRLHAAVLEAQDRAVAAIVPAVGDEASEEEIAEARDQAKQPAVLAFREVLAAENPKKVAEFQDRFQQECIVRIGHQNRDAIQAAQNRAFGQVVDAAVGALDEELRSVFTQDYLRLQLLGALQEYSESQKDHFTQAVCIKELELGGDPESPGAIGAIAELADLQRQKGVLEHLIGNFDAHIRYAQNMQLLAAGSDRLPRDFDPYTHFPAYIHGQKAVEHLRQFPQDQEFLPDDPGFVSVAGGLDEAPELGPLDALARDQDFYLIQNYKSRLQGRVEMAEKALLFSRMRESVIRTKLLQVARHHKRVRGSGAILKAQVDRIADEIDVAVEKVKTCRTILTKARVDQARFAPEEYSPDNPELYDFTLGFSDEKKAEIREVMMRHVQHFTTLRRNAYTQLGNADLAQRGIYIAGTILGAIHEKEKEIERLRLEHKTSERTAEDFHLVERFSEEYVQLEDHVQEYSDTSRIRVAEKTPQARIADIQSIRERHHEHELVSAGRLEAGMPLQGRELSLGGLDLYSDSDDESPRTRPFTRRRSVTSPRSPVSTGLFPRSPGTGHGFSVLERKEEFRRPQGPRFRQGRTGRRLAPQPTLSHYEAARRANKLEAGNRKSKMKARLQRLRLRKAYK